MTEKTKETKKRWLFFSWSYSRRSEDIAEVSGIEYFYFPLIRKIRFFQFPLLFIKTFLLLERKKPEVVFIQHPPIHSILPVFLYSLLNNKRYIIDSHIIPGTTLIEKPYHHLYLLLHRFYSYFAIITLFHSEAILKRLKKWRCKSMVFENPVREVEIKSDFPVQKRPAVGMVTSFSPDEHIEEVTEAAKELPNICFYLTGNKRKIPRNILYNASENIHFTGYIKGDYYYAFLKAMDAIIVLTDRKESALLGAYETISAETPLVTSDSQTMRYYFPIGAIFVRNNSASIKEGIKRALREKGKLALEIKQLKKIKLRKQQKNLVRISKLLER